MFETIEEVKNFVLWCKENKLKSFKISDIQFEISELSFIPEDISTEIKDTDIANTLGDDSSLSQKEFDDILYHSTRT